MTAILNILLEITVYSAILYGFILLFKKIFHKHISAALNYAVWAILIVRLLVPFTINSGFSLFVIHEPQAPAVQNTYKYNTAAVPSDNIPQPFVQNLSHIDQTENTDVNTVKAESPEPTAVWRIDWQTALVLLWAAGILGSGAYFMAFRKLLGSKIKRDNIDVPSYVIDLVEECKKELGIKKDIKVSMHGWLNSPALSAALKPRLLLPSGILGMSRQKIEFGIRHELTHCKRKDHLAALLLILLRCVYWFNPVVWLSFPQIQADMETLCDLSVTSGMKKEQRSVYISTMVELSCKPNVRYALGMGMCRGRKTLEKRIRGIYMKNKTKPSVKFTAALLACVMLFACFTTACQPTPSEPVVVNKGGDGLEQAILQTAAPQPSETAGTQTASQSSLPSLTPKPEMWQESLDFKDGVQVTLDAEIIKPAAAAIPALQVTPHEFTQQEAQKFVDFFMQGKPLYELKYVRTKADIEKEILRTEKDIQENKTETFGSEKLRQSALDDMNAQLKQQEDEYSKAPAEEPQPNPTTAEFKSYSQQGEESYKAIDVQADLGKTKPAALGIDVHSDNLDNSVSFRNIDADLHYMPGFEAADTLPGLNINLKDAQDKAEETLKKLGINDMQLASIEARVDVTGIEKTADMKNAVSDPNRKKCYVFIFSPVYNGIPVTYADPCYGMQSDDNGNVSFAKTWSAEEIGIWVDDTGVIEFNWQSPGDITKTVNTNLKLLDFKDIQGIFRKQIFYKRAWSDQGFENTKLIINTVKLGYMRIKMKDNTYMLLPVWDFIGDWSYSVEVYKDMEAKVPDTIMSDTKNSSFVTLNAIDGSDINRYLGY